MNVLKKIVTANPFIFALGVGAGLIGLYLVSKSEENKKYDMMLKELEEAIKVLEMKKLAAVEPVEMVEQKVKSS